MRKIISILALFVCISVNAQDKPKTQIVEAACGQCQFGMKGKAGCDLAVRIGDKSYFVDGTDIHKHGDAHAADGFCSAVRKAEVVGEVKNDRFVVTEFKLLPVAAVDPHAGHQH
ncbi:MAG: DUF6370 family protein [Flavobacterium sp.]|uniref:DUF6370 family protein n=1 Tax=Flavobacterium sp. TaxID=239 RepID=UPI0032634E5C